jgi:hypothetical protein
MKKTQEELQAKLRFFSGAASHSHKKQVTLKDEAGTTVGPPKMNEAGAGQSPRPSEAGEKHQEASKEAGSGLPSPFEGLADAPPQTTARFFERVF